MAITHALAAGGVVLASTLLAGAVFFHTVLANFERSVRESLVRTARVAAAEVDAEQHARLVGDEVVFVLDATPSGDADRDGVEDHSALLDPYPDAPATLLEVLRSGIAAAAPERTVDAWGVFLSGYAPVRNAAGQVVAAVGVDRALTDHLEQRAEIVRAGAVSAAVAAALSLVVAVGFGISSQLRLRNTRALAEARHQSERLSQARSELIADMSHELRTPLNGVIGMLDLLLHSELTEEQREFARLGEQSGERLLALINDVLDFSKLEASRLELEALPFDLLALVEGVVDRLVPKADEKRLELVAVLAANVPRCVVGDALRLRQVLMTVVGAAVTFSDRGTVVLRVTRDRDAPARLRFEVAASGISLPPDTRERLLHGFAQDRGSAPRHFGATSLGLAISGRLIALMGGDFAIESDRNTGAAFRFDARLSEPTLKDQRNAGGEEKTRATTRDNSFAEIDAGDAVLPFPTARVLVVEDNPVNQALLVRMLKRLGVQVDTADDGFAALDQLDRCAYPLVLMDCQLPGLDGFETTRRIRANLGAAQPAIVAITASSSESDRTRCFEVGMDDWLLKPVRDDTLRAALTRWGSGRGDVNA